MQFGKAYDVIVVGGGHAGCEAASAAARMGSSVLLITMDIARLAQMSCNPSMGGVAKGQIVREIDALGGLSGIIADQSTIQFRMLNRSKGPAMHSPRTQNDRHLFSKLWRQAIEKNSNIHLWSDMVVELLVKRGQVYGVRTGFGLEFKAPAVILTAGTFLNGTIHIGEKTFSGGRIGEGVAKGITHCLNQHGLQASRMKTGTSLRVDGRTIDYHCLTPQPGDQIPGKFSFSHTHPVSNQVHCYLAYTSPRVHDILRKGLEKSPLFLGRIRGTGPRYCPSIEDKIHRFADKSRHQLFIEPEGRDTREVYINGFSSSLPLEIQIEALKSVKGMENVAVLQPGYAIEYDYFPPRQLTYSLESRAIRGLFLAGQINGTTGYEEAAALGLMAGINAHQMINKGQPFILDRSQAYIGVLIDDLINKGTDEPYRMFTSRAEYRITLRQDSADLRLTEKSYQLGLASKERMEALETKKEYIHKALQYIRTTSISPDEINGFLESHQEAPIKQKTKLETITRRPKITLHQIYNTLPKMKGFWEKEAENHMEALEEAGIMIKYENYIVKEKEMAEKMEKLDNLTIPKTLPYMKIQALSFEAREKLQAIQPQTLGQASRISGVSPADISVLMIHLRKT